VTRLFRAISGSRTPSGRQVKYLKTEKGNPGIYL